MFVLNHRDLEFGYYCDINAVCVCVMLSCSAVSDSFATAWTIAHQAPLSMGFSRQEFWSRLLLLPPGDLPDLGTKTGSSVPSALAGGFFITVPPGKPSITNVY